MKALKTNQIGVRLDDNRNKRLEEWMERYGKSDKAQIFRELLDLYGDLYEAAEEAKLDVVHRQTGTVKKALASPGEVGTKKRQAS